MSPLNSRYLYDRFKHVSPRIVQVTFYKQQHVEEREKEKKKKVEKANKATQHILLCGVKGSEITTGE